jgi:hypothetical protein
VQSVESKPAFRNNYVVSTFRVEELAKQEMSMKPVASKGDMRAQLAICFQLISYLAHSSALKKEAISSSKTTVNF